MVSFPPVSPPRPYTPPLSSPIRATCPAHLILIDFINRPILGEQYRSFSSSLSSLILTTYLSLGLPSGFFPSGFPTKTLFTALSSAIRATCPAHLILLDFITRTKLGEQYKYNNSGWKQCHSEIFPCARGKNCYTNLHFTNFAPPSSVNCEEYVYIHTFMNSYRRYTKYRCYLMTMWRNIFTRIGSGAKC